MSFSSMVVSDFMSLRLEALLVLRMMFYSLEKVIWSLQTFLRMHLISGLYKQVIICLRKQFFKQLSESF